MTRPGKRHSVAIAMSLVTGHERLIGESSRRGFCSASRLIETAPIGLPLAKSGAIRKGSWLTVDGASGPRVETKFKIRRVWS